MMITYSMQARIDIKGIYNYLAYVLLTSETARRMYRKIADGIRTLECMPERYPLIKDEPMYSIGIRMMPIHNYLVVYKVDKEQNEVMIVRVLHKGMDIHRELKYVHE